MEVQFPIQIGLVGAPGSGKQALADEFVRISDDYFAENKNELVVVENSGNLIEREYDQAMAMFGAYPEDFWAFFNRYQREQELRQQGKSFISLGTALDNIAHCGVNMENIVAGIQTPETEQRFQRQQVAMTALTFLFFDRFRYIFGFYLPYKEPVILPGADESEARYNARVDRALQAIFANFGLRIQALDQPTMEEKAEEMLNTVKRIVENGPDAGSHAAQDSEVIIADDLPPELEATLAE